MNTSDRLNIATYIASVCPETKVWDEIARLLRNGARPGPVDLKWLSTNAPNFR